MKFTYPEFLYALFAVCIPILIHLFNFRKFKRVYFTNVKFLKELKQETQSQSRLRHLLVLASRVLAIIFLVLAFAQPYIPVDNAQVETGDRAISIYLDNSFSMDAINKSGSLLDEAKKRAVEIVGAFRPMDRFQLLTNDFEGKHQRLVNKEEFLQLLDEVVISPAVRTIPEITSRQTDLLMSSGAKHKRSFIVSDFQKSICEFDKIKNDTSISFNLIPILAQEKGNVSIDSCWFTTPVRQLNQSEELHVRIKNSSEKTLENYPVKLFINGNERTPASFNLEAGGSNEVVLSFASRESGIRHGRVELNDYPVTFDDAFYISYEVSGNIPLLVINPAETTIAKKGTPDFIKALFGQDSLFVYSEQFENKLDYSVLSHNRLIVLNQLKNISSGLAQELNKFVTAGGSLLVVPSPEADLNSYKEFLISVNADFYERLDTVNTKVERLNYDDEVFKDVFDTKSSREQAAIDLPKVFSHYVISKNSRSGGQYLMQLLNGDNLLNRYRVGKGKIYLSAVSLDPSFSNFSKHALFVPVMYKVAIYSQPAQKLFYIIGRDNSIETSVSSASADQVFHIKAADKTNADFDIIPEHHSNGAGTDIFIHNQVAKAGNYVLMQGKTNVTGLAFNYDRKESDLNCFSPADLITKCESLGMTNFRVLETGVQPLTNTLTEIDQGKKLWKLCVILALLFLGIEVLLLRLLK